MNIVKPVLTTTSEQWPPANNDLPKSQRTKVIAKFFDENYHPLNKQGALFTDPKKICRDLHVYFLHNPAKKPGEGILKVLQKLLRFFTLVL